MQNNDIARFCNYLREKLPTWKDLTNDEIDFHLFSSITNKVYKVTAKKEGCEHSPLILRHFCGLEGIVDKEKEIKVFAEMSKTGFGPQCYAHDDDIRLEEFIPSRCIKPHEYKEKLMRRKLARTMAAIHKLEVPNVDRTTLFELILEDKPYFQTYVDKCDKDIYSPEEKKLVEQVRDLVSQEERDFIKEILPREDVSFSHNDLLQGNVLISDGKEDVIFIDYEYASYNFRGYDIGNTFREATFDYGYPETPYFKIVDENFPNDEELRDFMRYYIVFTDLKKEEGERIGEDLLTNDEAMKTLLEKNYNAEELKKREDSLVRDTMIGVMMSAYYWAVWGLKMHKSVDVQFDYLTFVKALYDIYHSYKKNLFSK